MCKENILIGIVFCF